MSGREKYIIIMRMGTKTKYIYHSTHKNVAGVVKSYK